jgi:vanillate/3-O-methylgallate O-demethylase
VSESPSPRSLQDLIDSSPSLVDHLFSNRKGSVVRDAVLRQPTQFVQPEFTNWRDEQRAWRETVALYDQSYHMTTTFVRGEDALSLFMSLGVNGFKTFGPDRARHYVCCSPSGHVIGDGILYYTGPDEIALVGRAAGHNWLQYQAEVGGWNVKLERDEFFSGNPSGRRTVYRYQLEGPRAFELLAQLAGAPLPETKIFEIIPITIAGRQVSALRHTMAGGPGYEIYGPWDDGPAVKEAIIEAGRAYGLRQVGSMAYFTTAVELGWIPRPVPGIYTDETLRDFRSWLPANADEGAWSLGGSFYSQDISDYYFTPPELGYGHLVNFNHDFIGRQALEALDPATQRQKVTLVWDADDMAQTFASYGRNDGLPAKYIDLPRANYSTWQYDQVLNEQGEMIGVAAYSCLSTNERALLSVATIDPRYAQPGTKVSIVWGEPDGGAKSAPWLEPHRQVTIRATVTAGVHQ